MVGQHHHGRQQGRMHGHHAQRHGRLRIAALRCCRQMAAHAPGRNAGVDQDGNHRFPAKVAQHEGAVPAPGRSDHQHRRRCIGGERAANGDIDEEHTQRQVLEAGGHQRGEHQRRQGQCGNGHRGRLGDQRAHQRHGGQAQPGQAQGRGQRRGAGQRRQGALHRHHDGAGGGHDHDDKDKQGLGVVARFGVIHRLGRPAGKRHDADQHHGPETEDDLDLAQQMEDARMARVAVRQALELLGKKGVGQRDGKNASCQMLDGKHGVLRCEACSRLQAIGRARGVSAPRRPNGAGNRVPARRPDLR